MQVIRSKSFMTKSLTGSPLILIAPWRVMTNSEYRLSRLKSRRPSGRKVDVRASRSQSDSGSSKGESSDLDDGGEAVWDEAPTCRGEASLVGRETGGEATCGARGETFGKLSAVAVARDATLFVAARGSHASGLGVSALEDDSFLILQS